MTQETPERGMNDANEKKPGDILARLDLLFSERYFATLSEVAGAIGLDAKTLAAMAGAGRIEYVAMGASTTRPRRRFAKEHVLAFLRTPTPPATPRVEVSVDTARIREAVRRRLAVDRRAS